MTITLSDHHGRPTERVVIERLGHRGDGVASGPLFVPFALPGETVDVERHGERGRLAAIIEPSAGRVAPFCPLFTICGGCVTQHLGPDLYQEWKRNLVVAPLQQGGIETDVAPVVDAHGDGRRRATFHVRDGRLGFSEARSHDLVTIDDCPLLVPALNAALPAARAIANSLGGRNKPLDVAMNATLTGIDIDVRGGGKVEGPLRLRLAALADRYDLARLSIHGDVIVERRAPVVRFGTVEVNPPAGSFLQATVAADGMLAALVAAGLGKAKRIADLFAGCGTLSLPLAAQATVHAVDGEARAIAAIERAVRRANALKPVTVAVRDLFNRPLTAEELKPFDAVIFDPPRAGAEAQAKALAKSIVPKVIAVSCNPTSFARDAAILIGGGYSIRKVTPVDQFRHSAHVEVVALFERGAGR